MALAIAAQSTGGVVRRWATGCLDLLFPPVCIACGRPGHRICPACAQRVTPTPITICAHCGRVQPHRVERCARCLADQASPLRQVRAAGLHASPLREAIHLLKYEQRPDLAPLLGRYLVAAFRLPDWDDLRGTLNAVVPVPLHAQRRRERGYNQAELLAAELCRQLRLPLRPELLTRARFTQSQVGLSALERRANVEDAFAAAPACRGLHLLLVDDVYTTGATLRACAEAALAAGAASVSALTLALPAHGEDAHDPPSSTHAH